MTIGTAQRSEADIQDHTAPAPAKGAAKSASAFRTISEVAEDLNVPQHVLRFWETKFSQIKPLKRGGGRRYYRPEDMALLKRIHHLLYTEGYTIRGVQNLMKGQGRGQIIQSDLGKPQIENGTSVPAAVEKSAAIEIVAQTQSQDNLNATQRQALETMLSELKDMRDMLRDQA